MKYTSLQYLFARAARKLFLLTDLFELLFTLFFTLLLTSSLTFAEEVINLDDLSAEPQGEHISFTQENGISLEWAQALAQYKTGNFLQSKSSTLSFGIGAKPVWIHLAINNRGNNTQDRKILIDTSWLDDIQLYVINNDSDVLQSFKTGDNFAFGNRTKESTGFVFDIKFPAGTTHILARIATPDPLVLPVYILPNSIYHMTAVQNYYSYGFSYGYLIALIAFNAMLYFGLRDKQYLLYAIYLGTFTMMNISYTGHGAAWIWTNFPEWQRWAQPILMVLFGTAGFAFAITFLNIKRHSLQIYNVVMATIILGIALLIIGMVLQNQTLALYTSFTYLCTYTLLMLMMGLKLFKHGNASIRYYTFAMTAGILGVALTTTSTWGLIPFSQWTFRSIEVSMLVEATLLALALAARIRQGQEDKLLSEELANTDPLTQLHNRRSLYLQASTIWNNAFRHKRALSIIMLDVDHFKKLNDDFGHAFGDLVLVTVGKILKKSARKGDIVTRWGGEEFLLLLPETNASDAQKFAERLRVQLAGKHNTNNREVNITVSLGVAERALTDATIDSLIERADTALYEAKHLGRNRVVVAA